MDFILNFLVLFGLVAVGLCFMFFLPLVSNVLLGVWTTVMAERTIAKFRGVPSGTDMDDGPSS